MEHHTHTQAQDEPDDFEVQMPEQGSPANAEFFAKVEEVTELIERMKNEVDEVKRVQSSILSSPGSDDSKFVLFPTTLSTNFSAFPTNVVLKFHHHICNTPTRIMF